MSKPTPPAQDPQNGPEEKPPSGPNLVLMYALIALALLTATVIAAFIVLPFYLRR
jgi:hypothetical protein